MKKPIVRVFVSDATAAWFDNPFLECLRYAGHVNIQDTETPSGHRVFDLYPPKGVLAGPWAEMNAARMRSFGLDAEVAPAGELSDR